MAVRKFKPTTPGQRHKIIGVFRNEIYTAKPAEGQETVRKVSKITPEKSLTAGKRSTGGRNAQGHLTTRYRGGGHKRKLRLIDFKRTNDNVPATVKSIEYDPNRSARGRPEGDQRRERCSRGGQHASAGKDSCRYIDPLYRTEARPGSRNGPQRRHVRSVDFTRGRLRDHQIAFRRDEEGASRMPRHSRRGRQLRPRS